MKKTFGHELRRIRGLAGLTMKDLADEVGWSVVYISDIERERRNPPGPADIEKLLRRMGKTDALPEMLRLAAEARRSIEFKISRESPADEVDLLLALKRRLDQGGLDPKAAGRIREILDEGNEVG